MQDFDHFMNLLIEGMADKAYCVSLASRYPEFARRCQAFLKADKPTPTGMPSTDALTALQVGVCDNWGSDRPIKNRPNRYGAVVEGWTNPASKIRTHRKGDYQAKLSAILMQRKELLATLKRLGKMKGCPISAEWLTTLSDYAMGMVEGQYVGMLAHKDPETGTTYFDDQAIFLDIEDDGLCGKLYVDGAVIELPPFSQFMPDGETRLGGNFVFQSRADLCGFSSGWATSQSCG